MTFKLSKANLISNNFINVDNSCLSSSYVAIYYTDGKQWNKLQKEGSVFCSNGTSRNFQDHSNDKNGIIKGRSQWLMIAILFCVEIIFFLCVWPKDLVEI